MPGMLDPIILCAKKQIATKYKYKIPSSFKIETLGSANYTSFC